MNFAEQIKQLREIIEKVKKDIISEVFNSQKDIDTLKSSKLNSIEFYEFKNVFQGVFTKFESLIFLPEAVRTLGKI